MKTLLDRFNEKIRVTPGCWIWLGAKHFKGYGFIRDGKSRRSHHVSYELFVGDISDGMHVLHRCDNPKCVNPDHLFLGTHKDNMRDMINKGRQRTIDSMVLNRKLSAEDVILIRLDKRIHKEIANSYGVSKTCIAMVKRRETYAWVL